MQTSHDNNRIIISEDKMLKRGYQDESLFRKSELLNSLVAEGKLGMKTKEGFFKY